MLTPVFYTTPLGIIGRCRVAGKYSVTPHGLRGLLQHNGDAANQVQHDTNQKKEHPILGVLFFRILHAPSLGACVLLTVRQLPVVS